MFYILQFLDHNEKHYKVVIRYARKGWAIRPFLYIAEENNNLRDMCC